MHAPNLYLVLICTHAHSIIPSGRYARARSQAVSEPPILVLAQLPLALVPYCIGTTPGSGQNKQDRIFGYIPSLTANDCTRSPWKPDAAFSFWTKHDIASFFVTRSVAKNKEKLPANESRKLKEHASTRGTLNCFFFASQTNLLTSLPKFPPCFLTYFAI